MRFKRILRQMVSIWDPRFTTHEPRFFSSVDYAHLLAVDPLDLHTRVELSRSLADEGREREALLQLAICHDIASNFIATSMRDRLMIVSASCRIKEKAWRRGAVLSR